MANIDISKITYSAVAWLSDGQKIYLDEIAENIAWEENEKELAARLNLTLRDVPFGSGRLSASLALCTAVYLYADWGEGQKEIMRGTIWDWEHSQINEDNIILTIYDLLYYLQKSADNAYYSAGTGTKAILHDILARWGIPIGRYTVNERIHQKILYKNTSVASMLLNTLDDARKLGGGKSIIRSTEGKADLLAAGTNATVYSFAAESSLVQTRDKYSMADLVTRVVVVGKEDSNGRPAVEAWVEGQTKYGVLQSIITKGSSTIADAEREARELIEEKGTPKRTISLRAPDFPALRKGDVIHVTADRLNGYFTIAGISHSATNMLMQMEVEPY